jgi:hypothetical protein
MKYVSSRQNYFEFRGILTCVRAKATMPTDELLTLQDELT